ncbi:Transcription factor AP-2 [Aphelenchoides besseyi]|nr:Transcription factor AP-2 [Aphelenchoides besseyi]
MNSNVGDNNDGLPPFASSSGFANSRKRLRDSTDDEENIVPKRTVLTENSYNRQPFQPVTQSTPQNLGHYQPAFPLIPVSQAGFFENYGIVTQWPNHTYPPYQPQLSTQQLANNALPMSSTPMQPTSFPLIPISQAGFFENYGIVTQWPNHTYPPYQPQLSIQQLANNALPMSSAPMQPTSFFAQKNTFYSGVYTDPLSTLNTSSSTANDLFGNFPKQMASQNHNIKTKDDVLFQIPGRLGLLNENKKYQITISEIKRRLSAPETLNISYINGIIRKAKGQDAARALKQKLAEHGVVVSAGQRVSVKPNCFTALCEGEAMQLAEDFKRIMFEQLPKSEIKSEVHRYRRRNRRMYSQLRDRIRECGTDPDGLSAAYDMLLKQFYQEELQVVDDAERSLQSNNNTEDMNSEMPKSLLDKFRDFNMATHNFGIPALKAIYRHMLGLEQTGDPNA